jgi:hypothetical protein
MTVMVAILVMVEDVSMEMRVVSVAERAQFLPNSRVEEVVAPAAASSLGFV